MANPTQRATAVSIAMVSTTLGAVAGPNLVDVMGRVAMSIGVPALAGPFILAAVAFILAGLVFLAFLRPDPFIVAKAIAEAQKTEQSCSSGIYMITQSTSNKGVMILTQIVMVAIMTMTPIHMKHHGHGLGRVGLVIGIHIAAMFLPSLVTGVLADKVGRTVMSYASGAILLAASILAALAPSDSMLVLISALALLGLGWNFGGIRGTAIIVDATPSASLAKTQGTVDVLTLLWLGHRVEPFLAWL